MIEEWRVVFGFGGNYEVSSLGSVRSIRTGRTLVQRPDRKGYPKVALSMAGKTKGVLVHRLVLGRTVKPVVATNPVTGEQMRFPSVEAAGRAHNFNASGVRGAIYGRLKTYRGLTWTFADPERARTYGYRRPPVQGGE